MNADEKRPTRRRRATDEQPTHGGMGEAAAASSVPELVRVTAEGKDGAVHRIEMKRKHIQSLEALCKAMRKAK